MVEDKIKSQLVLAALLHDIGKLKQRADLEEDQGKTHALIGYSWLLSQYGEGIIPAGARNHHGNEPETWQSNISMILYEADNCAASERKTKFDPNNDLGKSWQKKIQLANIFARIRNPDPEGNDEIPKMSYHALNPLGGWVEPSYEERSNTVENYKDLWTGFEREFASLRAMNNHYNVDIVAHLLEKYTAFVPSITLKIYGDSDEKTYRKHPDISLFDHLKITAAAAECLYDYVRNAAGDRWEKELLKREITDEATWSSDTSFFLIIGGDISGVQNFIYTISSKGALKALKGRSFFLELLTEYTVDRILEELQLSRCNVIFTGGGHFYLLAPNLPRTLSAIETARREVNDYLLNAYNGILQQFIEFVPFGKEGFKDTTAIWSELSSNLEKAKLRKWENRLDILLQEPRMPHDMCLLNECQVCSREDRPLVETFRDENQFMACEPCNDQIRLGGSLQKAVASGKPVLILKWKERPSTSDYVQIGDCFYQVISRDNVESKLLPGVSSVMHLNDWDLKNFTYPASRPLFAGVYLPKHSRDLEDMAKNGFGMTMLSVLRMDVDRLGRIFSSCIPEGERIMSRMASLSRQLSHFFKFHLNCLMEERAGYPQTYRIIERQQERNLSIVYSGGDDLFLIGHWLDVTEAAFQINKAFERFTCNPFISLSAGITLGNIHEPVYRMAEAGGESLSTAKIKGRRRITIFDSHTFPWSEAEEDFVKWVSTFREFSRVDAGCLTLPAGSIPKGLLYRLLLLTREHRVEKAWLMTKLAYLFGRFKPDAGYAQPWSRLKEFVFSKTVNWHHLEVAILLNLMLMRREAGE